ncbi:hypothetical protein XELAEV_18021249mg [Xenopus laevis]|uniref:Uncharacterized protein n=1 Tax=Xenopus laevis TaxID=8355 RepID=A0A974D956_XENLA|nr:hypothetical protein XELAEV_18021249mg [Xenopus laevis]
MRTGQGLTYCNAAFLCASQDSQVCTGYGASMCQYCVCAAAAGLLQWIFIRTVTFMLSSLKKKLCSSVQWMHNTPLPVRLCVLPIMYPSSHA